jgi:hypothetical protein
MKEERRRSVGRKGDPREREREREARVAEIE